MASSLVLVTESTTGRRTDKPKTKERGPRPERERPETEGSSSSGRPKYFAILFSHYRTSQESYQKFPECRFLRIDGPWPIEQAKPGEIDSMVSKLKAAGNANVEAKYFYSQQEAEKFKEVRNNKVNADLDRCTTAQNRYVDSVRKGKQ